MDTLCLAINFNKRGVLQMAKGHYAAALASFQSSFDCVVALDGRCTGILPYRFSETWQLTAAETTITESVIFNDGTGFLFFDQCFVIAPSPKGGVVTQGDMAVFTATLLFNIAVCYACQLKSLSDDQIRRVLQQAYDVLTAVDTKSGAALYLKVAVSNNLGSLALERKDYETFEHHRYLLGAILAASGPFFPKFFAGNFATTADVRLRPASAA